jgi:hypothetical protein
MNDKTETLLVIRDCCTSGNCSNCLDLPFGQKVKVCQYLAETRERADQVASNWKEYKAEVHEVSQESLGMLTFSSAKWVENRLRLEKVQ